MVGHVRDSVQQVDDCSWLIDNKLLLRRTQSLDVSDYLWKDGAGWYYSIMLAPTPAATATPLSAENFPRKIYDVADAVVVFDIGDALLKVKDRHPFKGVTPEPITLRWLADQKLSFQVPKILFHIEDVNRTYSIVSRVPGKSIDEAWKSLNDAQKQQCVTRVAEICHELSAWTSDSITGIDGNHLFDPWLDMFAKDYDLSAAALMKTCKRLKMDTSKLILNHNDLGPTNVMVDVENDCNIAIVDWEMAGFVPFAWVRTKFATSWAMDFVPEIGEEHGPWMEEWRLRLAQELSRRGVPKVEEEYRSWLKERRA